jgi:multidrug resistance efflux pump
MGFPQSIEGHLQSVARGIDVANAQPNKQGLATVNPIYTWVRLAQRVPVRIEIDRVPPNVRLVAGMTATVRIVLPPGASGGPSAGYALRRQRASCQAAE